MGNLLFCHHKNHDNAVKSWRKGRKEEVEARPLPLTGKQPQQIGAADHHLGFLGAISHQRMSQPHHSHHHNPFGQYFHRYRRTKNERGEKKKDKVSSKSASKVTAPSIDNINKNSSSKFVSCSGLAYNSVAASSKSTTVFPSSFSNLNNRADHPKEQQPKLLLPNRSLSLQPPVTLSSCPMISRQELSIRHRKYPPLPSVPGGRTPTLKVPLKKMMSSSPASSSSSFHRSVSLGGRGGPGPAAAANVHSGKTTLATNRGHQSFKSSSSSSIPMNKTMTPGKPSLVARKR